MSSAAHQTVIRHYDPETDLDSLRQCIVEQQDYHRSLEPSWPEGVAIADEYLEYLDTQCKLHDGQIFVAEIAGELAGFACVAASNQGEAPDDPALFAWIYDIFVTAAHRRQRVASALMAEVESFARAHGATQLRLGVLARNEHARRFYDGQGFHEYVSVLAKSLA